MQKIEEWEAQQQQRKEAVQRLQASTDASLRDTSADGDAPQFISYVPLPEQKEIERRVMAKKKEELLAKYTSDSLIQQQEAAKQLLNVPD
jgi:pre-mRNA-splicing factor ISY1